MSNPCQGFCTLCGTGCAQHFEAYRELRAENVRLREALRSGGNMADKPEEESDE